VKFHFTVQLSLFNEVDDMDKLKMHSHRPDSEQRRAYSRAIPRMCEGSQFTLFASVRKGNRPFIDSAERG
jgi:D-Tyr-tRNAtyr deacylase